MRIICSGLPKTGTKTLASALRTLGYNVYDLEEQFYFLGKDMIEITNSGWTANDIQRIYTDVDAVTDVMSNCLWEDIFRVFPDAKVRMGFPKTKNNIFRHWYLYCPEYFVLYKKRRIPIKSHKFGSFCRAINFRVRSKSIE